MKELREYQKTGSEFLRARAGAILGDEVGLGKTLTAIHAALSTGAKDILVICPLNLKSWWMQEISEADQPINILDFAPKTPLIKTASGRFWVLAHHEQFINESRALPQFLVRPWDIIIMDECHKIKNRKAQRTKNIKRLKATRKWGLTGTPFAEKPQDLWSLLNWVAPSAFRSYWAFVNAYLEMDFFGNFVRLRSPGAFHVACYPYLLVRTRESVGMELPPLSVIEVPLDLTPEQAELYHDMRHKTIVELRALDQTSALFIPTVTARFVRLHQTVSCPQVFRDDVPNTKAVWLENFLSETDRPALIFSRYRASVDEINRIVEKSGVKGCIVGTYDSLGTGHNFQHLNYMIAWDCPLSYMQWEQAVGRVYRSGQQNPVTVFRLLGAGTVDERLARSLDFKQDTNEMLKEFVGWISQ